MSLRIGSSGSYRSVTTAVTGSVAEVSAARWALPFALIDLMPRLLDDGEGSLRLARQLESVVVTYNEPGEDQISDGAS